MPELDEKIYNVPRQRTTFGNSCKHYVGMSLAFNDKTPFMDQRCKAGVRMGDVAVEGEWKYRHGNDTTGHPYTTSRCLPCNKAYNFCGAKCDKAEFPTDAEVEQFIEDSNASMRKAGIARKAIIEHLGDKFGRGEIKCPVCNTGILRFSRARINGHVHAACSMEDCVRWME